MRAIVDIGSNSILLVVGRRNRGRLEVVHECARVIGLARGMAVDGRLRPDAIERCRVALEQYCRSVDQLASESGALVEELLVVGTEAARRALNGHELCTMVERTAGVPLQIISGAQEARLSYLSVLDDEPDLSHPTAGALTRVVDIGGASTELISGRGRVIEDAQSHPIGTVALRESHLGCDPVQCRQLRALDTHLAQVLANQPLSPWPDLYGVAGTVTSCASILGKVEVTDPARAMREVDGRRLELAEVATLREDLAALDLGSRRELAGMIPAHAEVIVTGASILLAVMRHCGAESVVVRNRGLRYALLAGEPLDIDRQPGKR